MSGIGKSIDYISDTGRNYVDSILGGTAWEGAITYAFPTSFRSYGDYPKAIGMALERFGFEKLTANAQQGAIQILNDNGPSGAFSVEGLTNVAVRSGSVTDATIRLAYTAMESSSNIYYGYSWLPENDNYWGSDDAARAGDVWLNPDYNTYLRPGNMAWYVTMHEIGHGIGLKHPFESYPKAQNRYDNLSHTVMSYSAYAGSESNFNNSGIDYPQSYMRSDIAALQHMYGADYSTNSGNTIYKWQPGTGNTVINGKVAISPNDNKIFLTIWDGGGTDTYSLMAYRSDLDVDLRPGRSSDFGSNQNAALSNGMRASGMVFNAYLHNHDSRSLIENVLGGHGSDEIIGNSAHNNLRGRGGRDVLEGLSGNDTLRGGFGADTLQGSKGDDLLVGNQGSDIIRGGGGVDRISFFSSKAGVRVDLEDGIGLRGDAEGDRYFLIENIEGSNKLDVLIGDHRANEIEGLRGRDFIHGLGGNDTLSGGRDADVFIFGAGRTHQDTITDFGLGGTDDRIRMTGFGGYENYRQVRKNMTQSEEDVHIRDRDGDLIVIEDTALADLSRDVFLFA